MNPISKLILTILILSGFFIPVNTLFAQIQITLDTTENCAGDTFLNPINVYQFDSIGSITLFIEYDTSVIEYLGHENPHPLVAGILSNAMRSGPNNTGPLISKIGISWAAGMGPVSLGNTKLLDLKFHFISDSCTLIWDTNSEITNYQAVILPVNYTGAEINEIPAPGIVSQPDDTTVVVGNNALFHIESTGITTYQWQVDSNGTWLDLMNNAIYSGVTTDSLSITNCQLSMSSYQYRCVLSGCIDVFSNSGNLYVSPASSLVDKSGNNFDVHCYPNPFREYCTLIYELKKTAAVKISIYNYTGQLVSTTIDQDQSKGRHQTNIDAKDLGNQKGLYFLRIESDWYVSVVCVILQ